MNIIKNVRENVTYDGECQRLPWRELYGMSVSV